jgi:hypothetical protein
VKATRIFIQICLLCAAMLPALVQAQFTFTTNNDGSLNLYQYTGSNGIVVPQQAWFDSGDRTKKLEMAVNTG